MGGALMGGALMGGGADGGGAEESSAAVRDLRGGVGREHRGSGQWKKPKGGGSGIGHD